MKAVKAVKHEEGHGLNLGGWRRGGGPPHTSAAPAPRSSCSHPGPATGDKEEQGHDDEGEKMRGREGERERGKERGRGEERERGSAW
eukprot:3930836-Rhodomonas_salina.1